MSKARNMPGGDGDMAGEHASSLELFMTQLAEIAPRSKTQISPQSRLIADLGFDSLAFSRLILLLYERYGVSAGSTASLRSEGHLSVDDFYRAYILGPGAPRG